MIKKNILATASKIYLLLCFQRGTADQFNELCFPDTFSRKYIYKYAIYSFRVIRADQINELSVFTSEFHSNALECEQLTINFT